MRDYIIAGVALVLLLSVPVFTDSRVLPDFLIFVFAYGLLAMSLNLLVGYTNLVSFGHATYFASGAYCFGLLMQTGEVALPVAFIAGIGFTAVISLAIGAICVRLDDIYFAFLTLAFQMLFHSLLLSWVDLTGGDNGLVGGFPRPPFLGIDLGDWKQLYSAAAILFVVCLVILRQVTESPFGYTLRLIRDNPARTRFLGINVVAAKLTAYVIASCIAAVGGMILTMFVSGAYPQYGFWTTSGEAIFMIMMGGTTVFIGPLVGAFILTGLNDLVTQWTDYYGLVLGSIILLFTLGLRKGILDFVVDIRQGKAQAALVDANRQEDRRTDAAKEEAREEAREEVRQVDAKRALEASGND